jgi:hypothetical protein
MTRKLITALLYSCALIVSACGGMEPEGVADDDSVRTPQAGACYAYLLDNANYSGPLNPFPINDNVGTCINLAPGTSDRTSSFRLAGCGAVFFDGANCTGASYAAATSGVMPAWFDNRASSLRFF